MDAKGRDARERIPTDDDGADRSLETIGEKSSKRLVSIHLFSKPALKQTRTRNDLSYLTIPL